MTAREVSQILVSLGKMDEKLDRAVQDISCLQTAVERNNEQLRLWRAIRVVTSWLIGTAIAVVGVMKGFTWTK